MQSNVHGSVIHNSQDMEAAEVPTDRLIKIGIYTYTCVCVCALSHSVMSDSLQSHEL